MMSAEVNAQSKADVSLWITDRFMGKTTTNARITYKGASCRSCAAARSSWAAKSSVE
ncbi:MAG: hypothetical protein ACLRQT_02870 [Alistipes sp.]